MAKANNFVAPPPRTGSRHRPEQTKAAILDAAAREFAHEGIAGARTEQIARSARVNKALLYYYFKDKETLYGAVLDRAFGGLTERLSGALDSNKPPREKILAYVENHFDYIASSPLYPRLLQREMMRSGRNGSPHIRHIVDRFFRPTYAKVVETIHRGIATGDFRKVDPVHFVPSMVAVIVFYFSSAPVTRLFINEDPLSPKHVAKRRAAVLDFISAALFRTCGNPEQAHSKKGARN